MRWNVTVARPPRPVFVVRDFRAFLDCGVPAHGFLRVPFEACGRDRIVPFSCKGRGFCPSCCGRRMAEIAAVHHVFLNAVFASLRRRTGLSNLGRNAKGGAVTFVQRFGDALNLNVHFHALALDGVYSENKEVLSVSIPPGLRPTTRSRTWLNVSPDGSKACSPAAPCPAAR